MPNKTFIEAFIIGNLQFITGGTIALLTLGCGFGLRFFETHTPTVKTSS